VDDNIILNIKKAIDSGPISKANFRDFSVGQGRLIKRDISIDERISLFRQRAESSGSKVHVIDNTFALKSVLENIIPCSSLVVSALNGNSTSKLPENISKLIPDSCCYVPDETISDDDLFKIDVAITDVALAVAETGSVVLNAGHRRPRMKSLVCQTHIALIWLDQIQIDLMDFSEYLRSLDREELPSGFSIISGPSKTADIELQLVIGVHGPALLHLVVIKE
jgi:L-lactate dehydrogenase complex protein LldG